MEKRKVSWQEFQGLVAKICRDISLNKWRPDYVVGITRGGLLPAVMISQYFNTADRSNAVAFQQPQSSIRHTLDTAFQGIYFSLQFKV